MRIIPGQMVSQFATISGCSSSLDTSPPSVALSFLRLEALGGGSQGFSQRFG